MVEDNTVTVEGNTAVEIKAVEGKSKGHKESVI